MKIVKESQGGHSVAVSKEDLALINQLSRKPLGEDEVYTFGVHLCDNEIDRDHERFSTQTLEQLAQLFVGKCGIFDHNWSAMGQNARIYRTEVVYDKSRVTRAGDMYCYLKGYAYMVRTQANQDLIAEIEGGIKKEVSVGCAVERSVCSICGEELGKCIHEKGKEYNGELCYAILEHAVDAYEFSFVAVPAQREAGVVKGHRRQVDKLWDLVKDHPRCKAELEKLEREAQAGRNYLENLRHEVVRLGGLAEYNMDIPVLRSIVEKLEERELLELKNTFEGRAEEKFALKPQLEYGAAQYSAPEQDGAFLI